MFFIAHEFFKNQRMKAEYESKANTTGLMVPARMQAYERIILFLERISPQSLILRVHKNGMSARMLQAELVKNIRNEYEHNLSQQIYVSKNAWEYVRSAREETVKIINIAASRIPESATGIDLTAAIFEVGSQLKKLPTEMAIDQIKKEFSQNF